MEELLSTIGAVLNLFLTLAVEILTLPCDIFGISDYWAIGYTTVAIILGILIPHRRR